MAEGFRTNGRTAVNGDSHGDGQPLDMTVLGMNSGTSMVSNKQLCFGALILIDHRMVSIARSATSARKTRSLPYISLYSSTERFLWILSSSNEFCASSSTSTLPCKSTLTRTPSLVPACPSNAHALLDRLLRQTEPPYVPPSLHTRQAPLINAANARRRCGF